VKTPQRFHEISIVRRISKVDFFIGFTNNLSIRTQQIGLYHARVRTVKLYDEVPGTTSIYG